MSFKNSLIIYFNLLSGLFLIGFNAGMYYKLNYNL